MALLLTQTQVYWQDTLPRDMISHSLHFATGNPDPIDSVDYQGVADHLTAAFKSYYTAVEGTAHGRAFRTKVYNLDDATSSAPGGVKRAPHAVSTNEVGIGVESDSTMAPRQVAAVLSFYSTDNQPRHRGRVYLGPFAASAVAADVIPASISGTALAELVGQFGAVGSGLGLESDIHWVTFSRSGAGHATVSHWWMDNRWDTVRKRLRKPTSRVSGTTGG